MSPGTGVRRIVPERDYSAVAAFRRDEALQYAAGRARATGRAYLVSWNGHALMDCAHNRRAMRECDLEIFARVKA